MIGPYKVMSHTLEIISSEHKGEEFTVCNDRFIHDWKTETEDRGQQDGADDITKKTNNNPNSIAEAREKDAP